MSDATRQVTLAYPYVDAESGKTLKADATHALPIEVADRLLNQGLAREPEPKPAAKKAAAKRAAAPPQATTSDPAGSDDTKGA